jgi:hypothetical protein
VASQFYFDMKGLNRQAPRRDFACLVLKIFIIFSIGSGVAQADPIPEDPVELPSVNVTAGRGGLNSALLAVRVQAVRA